MEDGLRQREGADRQLCHQSGAGCIRQHHHSLRHRSQGYGGSDGHRWPSGRHPCRIPDAAVLGIRGTGGRCDRGRIHRSSYRQGHREEASGCLICLGGITHESEHEAKALRRLVAGRAGKRAVRRVRFERPYGAAGRRLLACSVFHHHPAHHRTGKRHGGADVLPDALRMDGGLLGAALCAAQRVHLSLPPCDVPCAGQYPRPAAGQASDAAAGYGAGSFLRLV